MTNLEKKKKEAELMRVQASRMDLEVKIAEREDEIERLKQHIEIQLNKEKELRQELNNITS